MVKKISESTDSFGAPLELQEMANLGSRLTSLPKVIHIWSQGEEKSVGHGPRIKASLFANKFDPAHSVSISVGNDPQIIAPKNFQFGSNFTYQDFMMIREWVIKRKDILTRYWNDPSVTVDEIIG